MTTKKGARQAVEETAVVVEADAAVEYDNFGPTSDVEQAALVERIEQPALDDVSRAEAADEALAEAATLANLAEAERVAQEQAERDERQRLREIEYELARQRSVKFGYGLARTLSGTLATLKYEGKPVVGVWANNGNVVIMLNTEKQVTLYVDESAFRSYAIEDAIRAQAVANGHEPTSWTWNHELGRVSGCLLCDAMVRIGQDDMPRVDAYSKRCPKAAPIDQGKRTK